MSTLILPAHATVIQTFQFTVTSTAVKESIAQGKIASLLGVEGYVA